MLKNSLCQILNTLVINYAIMATLPGVRLLSTSTYSIVIHRINNNQAILHNGQFLLSILHREHDRILNKENTDNQGKF